jgi:hypothetical protein
MASSHLWWAIGRINQSMKFMKGNPRLVTRHHHQQIDKYIYINKYIYTYVCTLSSDLIASEKTIKNAPHQRSQTGAAYLVVMCNHH